MAYTQANDTGNYQQAVQSYYANPSDLYDAASQAFVVTPAAAELAQYAKALNIYVPTATATATVTVVPLGNADTAPVTFTYTPGNYTLSMFVRRVTAVTGANVVVTALCD